MTGVLDSLHRDHLNMVRITQVARDALRAIESGENTDLAMLEDAMRYVAAYPDVHHHPNEDIMFEYLSLRAPHLAEQIERMLAEHAVIIAKGQDFLRLIESIEEDALVERTHLVEVGREYFAVLDRHMSTEERDLFPAARKLLTEEDWDNVERGISRLEDPLFSPSIDRDFARLKQRIDAHSSARRE